MDSVLWSLQLYSTRRVLIVRLSRFWREEWFVRLSLYGSALSWTFYFSPGVTVSVTYAEQAVSRSDLL
jgi:hypothetical protein